MLLPIDHIPFQGSDLDAIAQAFTALGFTISTPGAYTSPDDPQARWDNRCIFLARGWFDLLHVPSAAPEAPVKPGSCLFLTDDLGQAELRMGEMRRHPPYRLERVWDSGHACETFDLTAIRERIAPLGLAVIQHAYPCLDARDEWFEHPNTAIEVAGLIFGGAEPGPAAPAAGEVLNLSGFDYWDAAAFAASFGGQAHPIAVRVRVASLTAARAALAPHLACVESQGRLHVAPAAPLGCGFQFFEA